MTSWNRAVYDGPSRLPPRRHADLWRLIRWRSLSRFGVKPSTWVSKRCGVRENLYGISSERPRIRRFLLFTTALVRANWPRMNSTIFMTHLAVVEPPAAMPTCRSR
jgi:hypothetical protein